MANKWGVLHFDQDLSDDPAYHIKRGDALYRIEKNLCRLAAPALIQMHEWVEKEWSEANIVATDPMSAWELIVGKVIGRSNVIPFARIQNPMMFPERLHYPIPACGAHERRTGVAATNYLPPEFLRPITG